MFCPGGTMATRAKTTAPPHRGGSKQAWLDEGLRTLADDGAPALRIDRLAGRLGLSKGSFYHHFDGMAGYKDALLAHFEREHTSRFIDAVESRTDLVAEAKLRELADLLLGEYPLPAGTEGDLEAAMRAWSLQNPEVRAAQARVDEIRLDYVQRLYMDSGLGEHEAHDRSTTLYVMLVGAGYLAGHVDAADLRRMWEPLLIIER